MKEQPKTSIETSIELLEKAIKDFKIRKAYQFVAKTTLNRFGQAINIKEKSAENIARQKELLEKGNGYIKLSSILGRPLPEDVKYSRKIEDHAKIIFNRHYLQPFDVSKGTKKPLKDSELRQQNELQRKTHGAMHASRVAAWVRIIYSLYLKYGDKEALSLTEEDIFLTQIAALFHDAARQHDGSDEWDSKSAELCYLYLKEIGIDEDRARLFANAARHKDTKANKTIIHKLIHDADCLDILRVVDKFKIEELELHNNFSSKNKDALNDIKNISIEVRKLIQLQNDLSNSASIIGPNGQNIDNGAPIESTFNLDKKKKYEHSENCFSKILEDISNNKILNQLYQNKAPLSPQREFKEKKAEANNRSSEENRLLKAFIKAPKYLHHSTYNMNKILRSPNPGLRSATEQVRWEEEKQTNFIPGCMGALPNNVFFGITLSMKYFNTPLFLDANVKGELQTAFIDINKIQKNNPSALNGVWSSSHSFYYVTEVDATTLEDAPIIGGSKLTRRYYKNKPKEYLQEISVQNDDDTCIKYEKIGDDIAVGDDISQLLGLKFIERLRMLGENNPAASIYAQTPEDNDFMSLLLEDLFKVDDFEVKIPVGILLKGPYATIIRTNSMHKEEKKFSEFNNINFISRYDIAKQINVAIESGNIEELKRLIDKGHPLDGHFYYKTQQSLPLATALKSGNEEMVKLLIKNRANRYLFSDNLIKKVDLPSSNTNFDKIEILAAALDNPTLLEILEKEGFDGNINHNKGLAIHAATKNRAKIVDILLTDFKDKYKVDDIHDKSLTALISACFAGNTETVRVLLTHKADINLQNSLGNNALFAASFGGHKNIVELLINKDAKIDLQSNDGYTALCVAAKNGHTDVCELLINNGAKIDIQNKDGFTALHAAASNGHTATCELLIKAGAKIDLQNKDGSNALLTAASNGYKDICELLLKDDKIDINFKNNNGHTALHAAAENGHTATCKLLVNNGADANIQSSGGFTALFIAAENGHTNTCELLVNNDADVNIQNDKGHTALHAAAQNGHTDTCKLLLNNGADANIQSNDSFTALFIAVENEHTAICELLINNGAGVNIRCNSGHTTLYIAAQNGRKDICELLINNGADVNIQSNDGCTALSAAAENGHTDICKLLIDKKANKNLKTITNSTALHIAAQNGHTDTCELLVDNTNINIQSSDYNFTALFVAAKNGHVNTVKLLIKAGAKVDLPANGGFTALMMAAHSNELDVVEELINHNANINQRNKYSETALDFAIAAKSHSAIKLLLKKGAYSSSNIELNDNLTISKEEITKYNNLMRISKTIVENSVDSNVAFYLDKEKIFTLKAELHKKLLHLYSKGDDINLASLESDFGIKNSDYSEQSLKKSPLLNQISKNLKEHKVLQRSYQMPSREVNYILNLDNIDNCLINSLPSTHLYKQKIESLKAKAPIEHKI